MKADPIRLTQYSHGAGCGCKIAPDVLSRILADTAEKFDTEAFPSLLVGHQSRDDAAALILDDERALLSTTDFFMPIVDDPYDFGQIAAANSLSDIYAMGGKPLFSLNIVGFPADDLPISVLTDILNGGQNIAEKAQIPILGGHSIKDDIPKYGLAVSGIIENKKIITNSNAKINDDIILTKPIGSGIISTAIKKNLANNSTVDKVIDVMKTLNNTASNLLYKFKVNACTDVTGYGLLGHLNEMCKASKVSAKINFSDIPLIDGVLNFAKQNIIPGGSKNNLNFYQKNIYFDPKISNFKKLILADAQTSGGLLISCPKSESKKLINSLNKISKYKSTIIGEFIKIDKANIFCK